MRRNGKVSNFTAIKSETHVGRQKTKTGSSSIRKRAE